MCVGGRKNLSFSSALVMAGGRAALLTRRENRRRQRVERDRRSRRRTQPSDSCTVAEAHACVRPLLFCSIFSLSPSRALICSAAFQPACQPCFPIQSSSPPGAALARGRSTSF